MSVVEVDDRGRLTMPKEMGLRGKKVIVIPASTYFVVLPLPADPYKYAKDWLKTDEETADLKKEAEEEASRDAEDRARRRTQPC